MSLTGHLDAYMVLSHELAAAKLEGASPEVLEEILEAAHDCWMDMSHEDRIEAARLIVIGPAA